MFKRIMVPIDLTHADKLEKALDVAGDLAAHYGSTLVYVGVTAPSPSAVAVVSWLAGAFWRIDTVGWGDV